MSILGIDVGSTTVKASVYATGGTAAGKMIASAAREHPTVRSRTGWAELDSLTVFDCIKQVIAECAFKTSDDPITAISSSSMGEAMTPVTKDRRILGNSILMGDVRGFEYMDEFTQLIGQQDFFSINPNILGPNYSLPKLKWYQQEKPDAYEKAYKFLLWGDMVVFMLGGEAVTSYSQANRTLLFDIRKQDWSDRLLALTGIGREKLPLCKKSGSVAGTVSPAISEELGLGKNVLLVLGGHDQCVNSLGAGIFEAGKTVDGIGTVECVTPTYDYIPETDFMLRHGFNIEHHVAEGLYVSFIYNQAGSLVRWFRDTFASADVKLAGRDRDIYDVLAHEMPKGPGRLITLPYFDLTGPPGFISDASGVIAGLKLDTTRGEILKSIMECATFYFMESIRVLKTIGIDTSVFVATGGGAKSDPWLQIKSNIFGVPFIRPSITEAGTLGAAIVGGTATGDFRSLKEGVDAFVKTDRVFEPDMKEHAVYKERYDSFKEFFPVLYPLLKKLP